MPNRRIRRNRTENASKRGTRETLREICNRNFNVVTLINLLVMTAYYLIFVTSTTYTRQAYAVSLSTAGFTAGIMVIGCLAGRFVTGNLLSFFGCRTILCAGLLLYTASIASFFLADSLPLLFIQRLLAGIGVGIIGTATGTIVAYVVPQQHHGFGISLFSMSTALALALGPFLGITLSGHMAYATLMRINVGIALGCLAIFFGLGTLPAMQRRHRPLFSLNSYIDPRVVRFSFVALVTCLGYGCVQAFMTSFAAERGLSGPASLFFLLYALAALACYPFFIFMLVQFLRGIPRDLDESAYIDGCGTFRTLMQIILPLMKPSLFSAALFQFMWTYNDYFNSLIFINSGKKYTVSLALRLSLDSESVINWGKIMATSFVVVLPLILLFFMAQKYFVEGIATSGLKG